MKKLFTFIGLILLTFYLFSCSQPPSSENNAGPEKKEGKKLKIGLVLSVGGRGDKSFNDSAYRGLIWARDRLGVEVTEGQPKQMAEDESYIRTFAEEGYDLVIGVGFLMKPAIEKVAKEFPDQKFAIVDEVVDAPNVASLVFEEHEGSFLVGALAGLKTTSGKIGFIGGMDVPLIHKFEVGFVEGVKYTNPDAEVFIKYIGSTSDAFHDPTKGKQLANTLFNQGIDIIYHAAGSSGSGVIEAAAEKNKLAIGVDSNQNYMKPGFVLSSMVKQVDVAVFEIIKDLKEGKFTGGVHHFGLNNDGVGYALDEYNKDLIDQETKDKLEDIKKKIISGEIKVTNYIEEQEKGK
ncbi:MAG: BMP family ABC transporter substrate-binding protein [bacterium]|nr:BMP family ABC transporter substrate-binding protein [bacterium]